MCRTLKNLIDGDNITNFVVILFFSAGFSMGIFNFFEMETAVMWIGLSFFGLWGGSIVVMFSWVGLCKLIKGV